MYASTQYNVFDQHLVRSTQESDTKAFHLTTGVKKAETGVTARHHPVLHEGAPHEAVPQPQQQVKPAN